MIDKCEDCPMRGEASPCIVQATAHLPYCGWARAGGRWRARVAAMSADVPASRPDAPRVSLAADRGPGSPPAIVVDYGAGPHGFRPCCGGSQP